MAKRKNSIIKTLLMLIFLGVLIAGIVIAVIKLTDNGGTVTDKPYSVTYDGVRYVESSDDVYITLPASGGARFDVKNGGKFTVDVLPNTSTTRDFEFVVADTPYIFSQEQSLKQAFTIETGDNYFILDCDKDYSVQTILNYLYGTEVDITSSVPTYPLKLVITSEAGKVINIPFVQYNDNVTISLDSTHIIF
jgi:hypothetical protein